MTKLQELEALLQSLKEDAEATKQALHRAKILVDKLEKRLNHLEGKKQQWGSRGSSGEIDKVADQITIEKRNLEDAGLPLPVFDLKPDQEDEYRVIKVTPKQIRLRLVGSDSVTIAKREGDTSWLTTFYGLNIEKTLERVNNHAK